MLTQRPKTLLVLALKADLTVLYCNDAYADFVGESPAGLAGQSLLTLFPNFRATQSYAAYCEVLETGQPREVEGEVGGYLLHTWVYRTPWGLLAIAEDITQQQQAAEQIKQLTQSLEHHARELAAIHKAGRAMTSTLNTEAVLKLVVEEIRTLLDVEGASLLLRDPASDDLIFASMAGAAAERLAGVRVPVTVGIAGWVMRERQPAVVNDVQNDPRFYSQVDSVTGLTARSIVAVPLKFKGAIWGVVEIINKASGAFTDHDREILEALASSAAVAIENARLYSTEQQHSAELARALEQQRELDRLQREFIQNVSHELRTPLGIIRGYAELLESGELGEMPSDQQEPISIIARRARMLGKLVDDIMAALEIQARELKKESLDLSHLARQAVSDMQVAARRANLKLAVESVPDLSPIMGDPISLRRVLDNLLGNALKFTPDGGSVTLRLLQNASGLELQVRDTGVGIPSDQLGRIFDRFYQVDGSATRKYGGVGLGLALVKEIVEAHGAKISVTSVVGQGTTFIIQFPAHEGRA